MMIIMEMNLWQKSFLAYNISKEFSFAEHAK